MPIAENLFEGLEYQEALECFLIIASAFAQYTGGVVTIEHPRPKPEETH